MQLTEAQEVEYRKRRQRIDLLRRSAEQERQQILALAQQAQERLELADLLERELYRVWLADLEQTLALDPGEDHRIVEVLAVEPIEAKAERS